MSSRKEMVEQMSSVVKAYLKLAAEGVAKDAASMAFPSAFRRLAGSLSCVSVASEDVAVRPDADYSDQPHIAGQAPLSWAAGLALQSGHGVRNVLMGCQVAMCGR